ncbi:ThuA domain-containing protein [Allomuricauda sp. F6463D]|uniref:ThuA domain-containing protein n=1 Tax=Allomuricauda sp. F6463D TaxID=2926409 RepID=UPI001FF5C19A|nr:ThuA domain-containing protein [Muricauda sp. F6463D]MCK0160537.1 ThuA domain-containing protein [Muricauda sp. F6463D]
MKNRVLLLTMICMLLAPKYGVAQDHDHGAGREPHVLPHVKEFVPGVYATGFAHKYKNANCGWIAISNECMLVDLPRGLEPQMFLKEVERISGTTPNTLVLTKFQDGDEKTVKSLIDHGVKQVLTSHSIRNALVATKTIREEFIRGMSTPSEIGDNSNSIKFMPLDGIVGPYGAAVYLPNQSVLFTGPLVVNGPYTDLTTSNTAHWITALEHLESLNAKHVIPGYGSWVGDNVIDFERRYLVELRRQIGYVISQGRPRELITDFESHYLQREVRIQPDYVVWNPYDAPKREDLEHVYDEMTVPNAPFNGQDPKPSKENPQALVLYADQPHEPGYSPPGLRLVFEQTGVTPHFTVDVRALTEENLSNIDLLVIYRDGLLRPNADKDSNYIWMTPEQESAIVNFVKNGGAFLNLHNSMGMYPKDGAYLDLVGGHYVGHGPLERFRVEVVDYEHPITQGVEDFSIADEQHTPPYDKDKVNLLLQSRADGAEPAAAGWYYEPGSGRLCHLAPGHTREALFHPMYQRLLRNAVNWLLRRE